MSISKLYSRAIIGMQAPEVVVEVHVAGGLPSFSIVGLADTEVKESRDRVRSAIQNSGYNFPARRITVNLAPADLPKDSARYDLPIALGILLASNLIKTNHKISDYEFAGELALDGELRHIKGVLPLALGTKLSSRQVILPATSAKEAALIEGVAPLAANNLNDVIAHLTDKLPLVTASTNQEKITPTYTDHGNFSEVRGQIATKKALEIAAAGRHSLLMVGNPGCGKSMLANRIMSILPPLNNEEAVITASLYSLTPGGFDLNKWREPPFRSPHHSISGAALVGGGSNPKPGEISLAHNGVLFLDELPEFDRKVLEVLREPLESKKINIARANHKVEYVADFQLIAAMNPCPCGNLNHPQKTCSCSVEQINRYRAKISEPLLDRIDITVEVPTLKTCELSNLSPGEDSKEIHSRVVKARQIQLNRQGKLNYELTNEDVNKYCRPNSSAARLIEQIVEKDGLSARGYFRLLKLARTIADLETKSELEGLHIAQARQYKINNWRN